MGYPNGDIKLSANFEINVGKPIDSRIQVNDFSDLSLIDFGYEGLIVWVVSDETHYKLLNDLTTWEDFGSGSTDLTSFNIRGTYNNTNTSTQQVPNPFFENGTGGWYTDDLLANEVTTYNGDNTWTTSTAYLDKSLFENGKTYNIQFTSVDSHPPLATVKFGLSYSQIFAGGVVTTLNNVLYTDDPGEVWGLSITGFAVKLENFTIVLEETATFPTNPINGAQVGVGSGTNGVIKEYDSWKALSDLVIGESPITIVKKDQLLIANIDNPEANNSTHWNILEYNFDLNTTIYENKTITVKNSAFKIEGEGILSRTKAELVNDPNLFSEPYYFVQTFLDKNSDDKVFFQGNFNDSASIGFQDNVIASPTEGRIELRIEEGIAYFRNTSTQKGLYYDASSLNNVGWATDDDIIPSIGLIKNNISSSLGTNGLSNFGDNIGLGGLVTQDSTVTFVNGNTLTFDFGDVPNTERVDFLKGSVGTNSNVSLLSFKNSGTTGGVELGDSDFWIGSSTVADIDANSRVVFGMYNAPSITSGQKNLTIIGGRNAKLLNGANSDGNIIVGFDNINSATASSGATIVGNKIAPLLTNIGSDNCVYGSYILSECTSMGDYNSIYGDFALEKAVTVGEGNSVFGFGYGKAVTIGGSNSSFGFFNAGYATVVGLANTLVGSSVYAFSTIAMGDYNTFIGNNSASRATVTSTSSTAIGTSAMKYGGGNDNAIFGRASGWQVTGNKNTTVGYRSGSSSDTIFSNASGTAYTGTRSTFIGANSGYDVSASAFNDLNVIGSFKATENQSTVLSSVGDIYLIPNVVGDTSSTIFKFPSSYGTAGQVLTDLAGDGILDWSTPSVSSNPSTGLEYTQNSHGFILGDLVYLTGGVWTKSISDINADINDSFVTNIVSEIIDVNTILIGTVGSTLEVDLGYGTETPLYLSQTTSGGYDIIESTSGFVQQVGWYYDSVIFFNPEEYVDMDSFEEVDTIILAEDVVYTETVPSDWNGTHSNLQTSVDELADRMRIVENIGVDINTAYVSPQGSDSTGELGVITKPFLTIHYALQQVPSINSNVIVLSGIYNTPDFDTGNDNLYMEFRACTLNCQSNGLRFLGTQKASINLGGSTVNGNLNSGGASSANIHIYGGGTINGSLNLGDNGSVQNITINGSVTEESTGDDDLPHITDCKIINTNDGISGKFNVSNTYVEVSGVGSAFDTGSNTSEGSLSHFHNCVLISTGTGSTVYGANAWCAGVFKNCRIENSGTGTCVWLGSTNSNNVTFENCDFIADGNSCVTFQSNLVRLATTNTMFRECGFYVGTSEIFNEAGYNGSDLGNTIIMNCSFNKAFTTVNPIRFKEYNTATIVGLQKPTK